MAASFSTVLSTRFNQDYSRFTVGTTSGFRVYRTDPLSLCFAREPLGKTGGGIAIAEVLGGTNIVALVGGGPSPRWPNNMVVLFDDHSGKKVASYQAAQCVLSVKLTQTMMLVVTERRVSFLDLSKDLRPLRTLDTTLNPLGLLALSYERVFDPSQPAYLPRFACLGGVEKELCLGACAAVDAPLTSRQNVSSHAVGALAISCAGDLIAVSSQQGTMLRVWSTDAFVDAEPQYIFRRGTTPVGVLGLAFETYQNQARFVLMATDVGVIHIFSLVPAIVPNKTTLFGLSYPYACYDLASKVPMPKQSAFVASEPDRITVVTVGVDGTYCKQTLHIAKAQLVERDPLMSTNFLRV